MTKIYSCNQCKDKGKEFTVPADTVGVALMQQHLKDHDLAEDRRRREELKKDKVKNNG